MVEENIKLERDRKKDNLLNKKNFKKKSDVEDPNDDEDISDRAPILQALTDKWKLIIKNKKEIIENYIKNATLIAEAFDRMTLYLGVDNIEALPAIIDKMESQMESIQTWTSKLTLEEETLEEEVIVISETIKLIQVNIL